MPEAKSRTSFSPYTFIIYILAFGVPVLVLPGVLDNAFNLPKSLLLQTGTLTMLGMASFSFLRGKAVPLPADSTPKLLVVILILNFFNFFYTQNPYFTIVAASLNISCLAFFYFTSTHTNGTRAQWLLIIAAASGVLVSLETYLQFTGHFYLFKWAYKGMMVMGTIGNSNYLGAYLVFPLFAMAGLIFLFPGKRRLIPAALFVFILGAFLFTRARAGWLGFFLSLPLFLYLLKRIHKFSISEHVRLHPKQTAVGVLLCVILFFTMWYAAPDQFHTMMSFKNVTKSDTLRLRIEKYYAGSWWLFKQNPLFGTGLWSFRNQVYRAQAEINQVDPTFFEDYPEPKPRRVHTEYLEILNDGGVVAGAVLLIFLLAVMRHGWIVIRDENISTKERTITATAFSSLTAVLLASLFFFSFRINSTLFMTVLMMGIVEGIYLHNHDLIKRVPGWQGPWGGLLIPVVLLILIGLLWFTGIKPFKGEMEHLKYKTALQKGDAQSAERHLLKALDYDPHNTAYLLYATQLYMNFLKNFPKANDFIDRAILDYNGDITRWALFYFKGVLKLQGGSLYEARNAFQKALYFNPEFGAARQELNKVNEIIKNNDRIMIKFR